MLYREGGGGGGEMEHTLIVFTSPHSILSGEQAMTKMCSLRFDWCSHLALAHLIPCFERSHTYMRISE